MTLLVVGSTAFDTIETPFGSAEKCLGGSSTYFGLAARLFTPVRLVSVVGEDFPPEHRQLLADRGPATFGCHAINQQVINPKFEVLDLQSPAAVWIR